MKMPCKKKKTKKKTNVIGAGLTMDNYNKFVGNISKGVI
jgi:hypothetical protein